MSDIGDDVVFKKENNTIFSTSQQHVGLSAGESGLLVVKLRLPKEELIDAKEFFETFKLSEPVSVDIGGTGDINCLFKGISKISPISIENKPYFALSITLIDKIKECIKKEEKKNDGLGHQCVGCGLH